VSKRIDVPHGGQTYECFLVSTSDATSADPIDHYIIAGLGWAKLRTTSGTIVELAPLSPDGLPVLEELVPLLCSAARPRAPFLPE
jgi:hypothetical protein